MGVPCLFLELFEGTAFFLIIEIGLKVAHFVGDKAECVMEGEPFDICFVFVEVFSD